MLKLHKLFKHKVSIFCFGLGGIEGKIEFIIASPDIESYAPMHIYLGDERARADTRPHAGAQKKYIFFDDLVSATVECHPYPG